MSDDAFPEIAAAVETTRRSFDAGALRHVAARADQLTRLRAMLVEREGDFAAALRDDLGKSSFEAYSTEIGFTINEIDHALSHLDSWTAAEKVKLPLHLRPGSAEIRPEPLGSVLIIAPWNYPLQLLLAPLVAALAAGNTALIKPSEIAPATAAAITATLPAYVSPDLVQVVNGGVPETTALLGHRFDHIFYTGNGNVGKVVMRAAAEHLTPVTLELGGKSPAVVAADARVDVAARRIAWGKFINAGQTCVAPDYVLVDESVASQLVAGVGAAMTEFFGADPALSPDYGRIVSERHLDRLIGLLDGHGGTVVAGGVTDRATRYLAPTVITNPDVTRPIMQEEIFGPILPIIPVASIDESVRFVSTRPKPLALYVFSELAETVDAVLTATSAGGVTVNHTLLHLAVPDLPFGGVGASGFGRYHGKHGFDVFSHHKPILRRRTRPDPSFTYPPYGGVTEKLLRRVL